LKNRFVVAIGAASCAVSVASCAAGPSYSTQPKGSVPNVTAEITINGNVAANTHDIRCYQDGWNHTVEAGTRDSGVKMVLGTGDKVTAKSVVLTNIGGFTGSFIENQIGESKASIIGSTFKVSGTADGATTDDPNKKATASFEIKANC
jgi:lipoprotein LpqH